MSELLKSLVKIVVIFVIAGLMINNGGAYLYTKYQGQDLANQVANSFATGYAESGSISNAVSSAQNTATSLGTRLISYKLNETDVEIVIELNLEKTVIIKRIDELKNIAKVRVSATAELK